MSYLKVLRRHIRTDPLYDKLTGIQVGWYTKPADWYIARAERTRFGLDYTYNGLENEKHFKTKKDAIKRKKELEQGL